MKTVRFPSQHVTDTGKECV